MAVKLPHKTGYPGEGMYYVLCDVCGKKMRARDAISINDKFNTLSKMLVCPQDVDKTNPQQYLKARRERQIRNPDLIRSEQTDNFAFISSPSEIEGGDVSDPSGRNPSAPNYLTIFSSSATIVELIWKGPVDPGSSAIKGYKIERESPVGGGFSTVTADTGSVATYYKDTGLSASAVYNYRVSAVNNNGTGSTSNESNTTTSAS